MDEKYNSNDYIKLRNNRVIKKEVLEKAIYEYANKELTWYKDAFTAIMYRCYGCSSCQYSKHKTGSLWQCTLHPNPNRLCDGKNYIVNEEFFEREFKDELKNIRG